MADCKRKTANLFDKSSTTIHNAYFNDADRWLPADDSRSIVISVKGGTQYTLSVPEAMSVFRICEASQEPVIGNTYSRIVRASSAIDRYTFTTQNDTKYIIFQGGRATVDTWFNGLMLNSGSTPLPYEPYWQHSLRKLGTSTDTITTLPSDLYADGQSATVGLVGNMSQTGTPTPTTPIQPSETGERTGNLFDLNALIDAPSGTINNVSFTHVLTLTLKPNTAYTMASNGTGDKATAPADIYRSLYFNGSTGETSVSASNPVTVTTDETGEVKIGFFSERTNAQQYINNTAQAWLTEGSTSLPYEPYGYKIPILNNSQTTNVYLGEVESTRRIYKTVLTGQETWTRTSTGKMYSSNALDGSPNYKHVYAITTMCSHYKSVINAGNTGGVNLNEICLYGNPNIESTKEIYVYPEDYATAADFATYLQQQYANGTPVTVWYVLATETTGIVNETIRKIGDYADTVSGITIPTTTGKDTFDVQTTLKPSEVSLAYTGWHDASAKEFDGSEWKGDDTPALLSFSRTEPTELTETTEEPEQEVEDEQSI